MAKLKPLLLVPVITCLTLIFACNEKPKDLTVDNSQKTSTQEDLEINEPIVVENDSQISALEETEISEPDVEENDSQKESLLEGRELFYIVDDLPTFNGGEAGIEFRKYIARNIRYPESAAENDIYGRILVQFVIDKTGSVMDATVVRSLDPALDKEAIRVVMSSPAWEPGKHMGKLVEVLFTFPINFVLNKQ